MKHVAAVLLLALGEKEINEKNINDVLASVGVKPNANCVKLLVAACKGKKPADLIKEGASKLAVVAASAGAGAASVAAVDDKKEDKKDDKKGKKDDKKKKEEPKEEEEEDMGFGGLF